MNIHYRCSKIFCSKVLRSCVDYAVLTVFGMNITMLVKVFVICDCYRCLVALQGFG